ncbi:MAG: hypothetical protein IJZ86_02775 [Bacteroides sp.]|nr:hypothetical protein [Bacteroides sp.]
MKYTNKLFAMLALAVVATACDPDSEGHVMGEQDPAGCQNVYFNTSKYTQTVEVEPGTNTFVLSIAREVTDGATSVALEVKNNENNVFQVPATVTFEAGQATAPFTVTVTDAAELGVSYNLLLAVTGEDLSNYPAGYQETSVNFTILKWEPVGTGYWKDGLVGTFFGVSSYLYAVEIEKTNTANSLRYRFDSPYAKIATAYDEYGIAYNGYIYNEEADLVPGEYVFAIDITEDGAALIPTDMGMDWGYGMFSTGSVYGNLSQNIGSYPLGIYDEEIGMITFPANSLYCGMANYGTYAAGNPSMLFLSYEAYTAYLASLEEE